MKNKFLIFTIIILTTVVAQKRAIPKSYDQHVDKERITYSQGSFSIVYSEVKYAFGLRNHKTGETLLPTIFKKIEPAENDSLHFLVSDLSYSNRPIKGLYHVNKGFVLPLVFTSIQKIKHTNSIYYLVERRGKRGILRSDLSVVLPVEYDEVDIYDAYSPNLMAIVMKKNPYSENRYGLFNVSSHKMVMPVACEHLYYYQQLGYIVKHNGRHTVLDENGNSYLRNTYELLQPVKEIVNEGEVQMLVSKNGLMGVIDLKEKEMIPLKYKSMDAFYLDPFVNCWMVTDPKGKEGVVGNKAAMIIPVKYDRIWPVINEEEMFLVAQSEQGDDVYAMINDSLQKIMSGDAYSIGHCYGNYFSVSINGRYGVISSNGEVLVEPKYDHIMNQIGTGLILFKDKMCSFFSPSCSCDTSKKYDRIDFINAAATLNGKVAVIDYPCGKEITPFIFDEIKAKSGSLVIAKQDGKYGIYDLKKGKYIVKPEYEYIHREEKVYFILKEGRFKKVSLVSGTVKVEEIYKEISPKPYMDTSLTRFNLGPDSQYSIITSLEEGKLLHGLIDQKKAEIVIPTVFEEIQSVGNSSQDFIVKMGQTGIYSIGKGFILPPKFKYINTISIGNNMYYFVYDGSNARILKEDLSEELPMEYANIGFAGADSLKHLWVISKKVGNRGLVGLYNLSTHKIIVEPSYYSIDFNYKIGVVLRQDLTSNLIDSNGHTLFNNWYDHIEVISQSRFIVKKNGYYGIVDNHEVAVLPIAYKAITNTLKYYFVTSAKGKGIVDENGKWVVQDYDSCRHARSTYGAEERFFILESNKKHTLYKLTPDTLSEIYTSDKMDISKEPFISVKKGKHWGIINFAGKQIMSISYDSVMYCKGDFYGFFIATRKSKKQIYNVACDSLSPVFYDDVQDIGQSYYKVSNDSKVAMVSPCGNMKTTFYDEIIDNSPDYLIVKSKGKYGLYHIPSQKYCVEMEHEIIIPRRGGWLVKKDREFAMYYFRDGLQISSEEE